MIARVGARPLNPVLARELKQRMRGRRSWLVLTVYLVILAAVLQLLYQVGSRQTPGLDVPSALAAASVGRSMFQTLLLFMLVLVCFIVPGLTAGAVAGERERQTLVPLQVTLLSPAQILVGKLLASLAFVTLLLVAALPLISVSFLMGGVTAADVARGTAMVLAVAVMLACVALALSATLRRVQTATVAAYALTGALAVGTFLVYAAQLAVTRESTREASQAVLSVNPFMATAAVVSVDADDSGSVLPSPFDPLQNLIRDRRTAGPPENGFVVAVPGGGPANLPGALPGAPDVFRPSGTGRFWLRSLGAYAVIGAACLWLAGRRLRTPSRGET